MDAVGCPVYPNVPTNSKIDMTSQQSFFLMLHQSFGYWSVKGMPKVKNDIST